VTAVAITRERFLAATGREPVQDDLVRCNCVYAGNPGHWYCGWDAERDLPRFMSGAHVAQTTSPRQT
jgi:hypothetical protein